MLRGERIQSQDIPGITTYPVGTQTISAITMLAGEGAIGNVVVRACPIFAEVKASYRQSAVDRLCDIGVPGQDVRKQAELEATSLAQAFCVGSCAMRALSISEYRSNSDLECPEKNSRDALERLGLRPEQAIFVAVTGNRVGFADQFNDYIADGSGATNPEGWRQATGFNAFFSDVADTPVLARRLADCGDVNVEFQTQDDRTIIGFMHLTRPGQTFGIRERRFSAHGEPVSYFEYALRQAADHYDINWQSLSVVLRTGIEAQDFQKRFSGYEAMEAHIPGWLEDGFVQNATNPKWQPGDDVVPTDIFYADFKGIILRDILETFDRLHIDTRTQFDMSNMLDTMHSPTQSSYERAQREKGLDTRDLYVTYHSLAVN